ncbi:TA system VapC family ribonuclease toxin [Bradyrhizobium sp. STM 3562]|uniref:TA system VapC family ribonuclease toxin n=1 Tax=Bradyrhizobium sp. STM 3562 TaxID=578924 RepID=UPI00388F9DD0
MILVDANILLYACNSASDLHAQSRDWLDEKLNGAAPVGLPWSSLLAFLRIATNPRAFRSPLTMAAAWEQVSSWLSAETAWAPEPTDRHADVLAKLLALPGVYGNLVPDAHLAALAIEHGLTLCSTDGDFARFPGLTWLNPLAA